MSRDISHKPTSDQLLGTAPLGPLILKLAVPAVAAQLINAMYNIVDRIYIGNIPGIGATALTGVGVTFPIIMLVSAFAAFAGMGGAPLASIRLGTGDKKGAERILGTSFCMLLVLSAVLTVVFQVFKRPLLYAFGASDALIDYALDYITIYLWGTISVQLSLGLNTFISAQGNSTIAMLSVLLGAVLNLVLDPLFIFTFNMGVKGAAIATVISQTASAVWVVGYLFSKKSVIRLRRRSMSLQPKVVAKIAALGVSPFVMQSTESLVTVVLNSGMQRYGGDLYVGTITILQSIMQMIILPLHGITSGTQPIISYNYGAKNYKRVRQTFKTVLTICLSYTVVLTLAVVAFARPLTRMFTPDPVLLSMTVRAIPIFFGGMWAFGAQNACQSAFMGLGQAKISLFLALLRKVVLLVPLAIALPLLFGGNPTFIYAAEPIADVLAAATTTFIFLSRSKTMLPAEPDKKG